MHFSEAERNKNADKKVGINLNVDSSETYHGASSINGGKHTRSRIDCLRLDPPETNIAWSSRIGSHPEISKRPPAR